MTRRNSFSSPIPTTWKAGQVRSTVDYPVWPDGGTFRMNFDFEPLLFSITDGSQSALALFNPVSYGASAEQAVYAVRGTYTFADTGERRAAELYFKDGQLFQVFGFKGGDIAQQPSQITPTPGTPSPSQTAGQTR